MASVEWRTPCPYTVGARFRGAARGETTPDLGGGAPASVGPAVSSDLAGCLGTMRRQIEECVTYARHRKQFGQPIGKFQSVANRIVDMKLRYETARMLVYRIGWLKGLNNHWECKCNCACSRI